MHYHHHHHHHCMHWSRQYCYCGWSKCNFCGQEFPVIYNNYYTNEYPQWVTGTNLARHNH